MRIRPCGSRASPSTPHAYPLSPKGLLLPPNAVNQTKLVPEAATLPTNPLNCPCKFGCKTPGVVARPVMPTPPMIRSPFLAKATVSIPPPRDSLNEGSLPRFTKVDHASFGGLPGVNTARNPTDEL